jgi:hypothetical protein
MKIACRSRFSGSFGCRLFCALPVPRTRRGTSRASSYASVLSCPLPEGGALQHAQYSGRVRRVDAKLIVQ